MTPGICNDYVSDYCLVSVAEIALSEGSNPLSEVNCSGFHEGLNSKLRTNRRQLLKQQFRFGKPSRASGVKSLCLCLKATPG